MENKVLYGHKCLRCGKEWWSKNEHPVTCRWCKNPYWNRERVNIRRNTADNRVNEEKNNE